MFFRKVKSKCLTVLQTVMLPEPPSEMRAWIPFEITTESMENTDEAWSEAFRFIHLKEHTKNNVSNRRKETV